MNHVLRCNSNFRWQGAYGAFSVSPDEVARVRTYIHNQVQLHAENTLKDPWERTDE